MYSLKVLSYSFVSAATKYKYRAYIVYVFNPNFMRYLYYYLTFYTYGSTWAQR